MRAICGRHVGNVISSALVVVLVLVMPFPSRAGIRADTILSIVLQDGHVVVSTNLGLREKTTTAEGWSAMPLPPGARPGGCLNISDVETAQLYYLPPVRSAREWTMTCMPGLGLWTTVDFGRTWTEVDRTHVFSSVLVHRSGVIYAVGRSAEEVPDPEQAMFKGGSELLSSRDGGVSWAVVPETRFWTLSLFKCGTKSEPCLWDWV